MSDSREDSPDWLRSFQAPTQSIVNLSSDSEASLKNSPLKDDVADKRDSTFNESQLVESDEDQDIVSSGLSKKSASIKSTNKKTPRKRPKVEGTPAKRRKTNDAKKKAGKNETTKSEEESSEKQTEVHEPKVSSWTLSSDSESEANVGSGNQRSAKLEENEMRNGMDFLDNKESVPKVDPKGKSSKKSKKYADTPIDEKKTETKGDLVDVHVAEKTTSEKHVDSRVSSSMLPLVIPEKVQRSKALVECEGDSIDLSGDIGAVGRVIIAENPPGDKEMLLDLKGTIYRTTIVPSRTFCVVSVGPSEAKIEAIMNDFIRLKPQSNVYDAETMVEGTLDGFSFDSEDEADKMSKAATQQDDQNEGAEDHINGKTKAKSLKKPAALQKKGKSGGGKQVKKRKPQAGKKGKSKK